MQPASGSVMDWDLESATGRAGRWSVRSSSSVPIKALASAGASHGGHHRTSLIFFYFLS